jgi:hypothetical protein
MKGNRAYALLVSSMRGVGERKPSGFEIFRCGVEFFRFGCGFRIES